MPAVRPAAVAGLFYPAEPAALRSQLSDCLAAAAAPVAAHPAKVLIVPHAGYVYSGDVAACAYAPLQAWRGRITRVVLLGPAHRVPVRALAAPRAAAFETPLGRVTLDRDALAAIADLPQVEFSDLAHEREHSLEVQLPFLQMTLDTFTLVPLVVGDPGVAEVTEVLARLWGGDETLIVISSDLSHYLPYAHAQAVDRETVQRVLAFATDITPHEACGAAALNGALQAARAHGLIPHLLDLRNSGDTAGDRGRVVGYAALAFEEPDDSRARAPGRHGPRRGPFVALPGSIPSGDRLRYSADEGQS